MVRRIKFIVGVAIIIATVAFLVYSAVDQTKMYMVTVAEYLGNRDAYAGTTVRIAGRVRQDSMHWESVTRDLTFTLDDMQTNAAVEVHYRGLLPDMFAEDRDVVVEGPYTKASPFEAKAVLTKAFGSWAKKKVALPAVAPPVEKADGTIAYAYKDTPQGNVFMGHLGITQFFYY